MCDKCNEKITGKFWALETGELFCYECGVEEGCE